MHTWDLVKSLPGILCTLRADVAFRSPSTPVYRNTSRADNRNPLFKYTSVHYDRSIRQDLPSIASIVSLWWNTTDRLSWRRTTLSCLLPRLCIHIFMDHHSEIGKFCQGCWWNFEQLKIWFERLSSMCIFVNDHLANLRILWNFE